MTKELFETMVEVPENAGKQSAVFVVGYARVSTDAQSNEVQKSALIAEGCRVIYQEKMSGVRRDRPALLRMISQLREGDVVVAYRLDRMGRDFRQLLDIITEIRKRGAHFKTLDGVFRMDTRDDAMGNLIFMLFAALAEFERAQILERTSAGRANALAKGVKMGRKPVMTERDIADAGAMYAGGMVLKDIAERMGVSKSTVYSHRAAIEASKAAELPPILAAIEASKATELPPILAAIEASKSVPIAEFAMTA